MPLQTVSQSWSSCHVPHTLQLPREALTLEALSTWLRLGEPAWGAEHTRAWPALCTLLRSRSEAVRGALRGMMAAQLAVVAPEVKARENGAKALGTARPPAHA